MFGKKEDKAGADDAARAEADRLVALPVADLAVELMPAFGPTGPNAAGTGTSINMLQVTNWLMADYPKGTKYLSQLNRPVREGLDALVSAGLLERFGPNPATGRLGPTRLGETVLADGSIRDHLT